MRRIVLGLLLSASVCAHLGSLALGEEEPKGKEADKEPPAAVRVMSFNIRYAGAKDGDNTWSKRRDLVVKTIKGFDPDLLGLQEVLPEQAAFLQRKLRGHGYEGVGREDGKQRGEACPVLWRTKRFRKVEAGHFWLSPTPDVPGSKSWDASLSRLVTWVELTDLETEEPIVFLNTHWDHEGKQSRHYAAKILRRAVEERERGVPVVITGDFNATEKSVAYRTLLHGWTDKAQMRVIDPSRALVDAYRSIHHKRKADELTYHAFEGRTHGLRIDWVLHNSAWKTTAAGIDRTRVKGRLPSDHYPVTAVLTYRRR